MKPQQLSEVLTSGMFSEALYWMREVIHKRQQDACSPCAIVEKAHSKQLRLDTSCMEQDVGEMWRKWEKMGDFQGDAVWDFWVVVLKGHINEDWKSTASFNFTTGT